MAELGTKKQRNYVLDFWKVIFSIYVAIFHWAFDEGGLQYYNAFVNGGEDGGYLSVLCYVDDLILQGIMVLGFFTFTTGYWLVDYFKKHQRASLLGKGKDLRIVWNYWSKNYAGYAPYIFFSVFVAFVVMMVACKVPAQDLLQHILNALPEALGFYEIGFCDIQRFNAGGLLFNLADPTYELPANLVIRYGMPLWYMSNIICFGALFMSLFIFNESLVLFAVGPFVISKFLTTNWLGSTADNIMVWDTFRLWGPAFVGIYAWYLIDYIKHREVSKKLKRNLTIGCGITLVVFLYWTFFWSEATQLEADLIACLIAFFSLLNIDNITVGANKILDKIIPVSKNFGSFGLGYFLLHYPVIMAITALTVTGNFEVYVNGTANERLGIYLGILTVLSFIFVFVDKYVLKPIIVKLINAFGSRKPIVIEEPDSTVTK